MSKEQNVDVLIVGGGPAGLAAGLYTARDRYSTVILEKNGLPGGQIMLTERIENYPGWQSITGPELIEQMANQTKNFGATIATDEGADGITRRDDGLLAVSVNGGEKIYLARAVILAPGSDYRRLDVPGEQEMRQATRVSYCATCDGSFYRDKHVLAIGGGNTAVEDTIYLATRFCRKVTMIHRRKEFRAQQVLVEELYKTAREKDLDIKLPYVLEEIVANADRSAIDHVRLRNLETNQTEKLNVDGVFVFVGMVPNTGWLKGAVALSDAGYIEADPVSMKTSLPGVFVAGDCRTHAPLQLATACADGVTAAMMIKQYFRNPKDWKRLGAETSNGGW